MTVKRWGGEKLSVIQRKLDRSSRHRGGGGRGERRVKGIHKSIAGARGRKNSISRSDSTKKRIERSRQRCVFGPEGRHRKKTAKRRSVKKKGHRRKTKR